MPVEPSTGNGPARPGATRRAAARPGPPASEGVRLGHEAPPGPAARQPGDRGAPRAGRPPGGGRSPTLRTAPRPPVDIALGHLPAGARPPEATRSPAPAESPVPPDLKGHSDALRDALEAFDQWLPLARSWGERLARVLGEGGRLLTAGNGGSAAQAQHLTAELVGRYHADRPPYSALALHADTSTTTAVANDYGVEEIFARQVRAHGRPGDVLLLLSTSGASANLRSAAHAGRQAGLRVWALTGPAPNPLAAGSDESLAVAAASPATVQELHLHTVHLLCTAFDAAVAAASHPGPGARDPI